MLRGACCVAQHRREFVMQPERPPRRRVLLGAAGCAAALALPALASSRRAITRMTDGPFYPPRAWRERWSDWDAATLEIWQCDALGHYRHPSTEPTVDAVDNAFQGFGSSRSDAQGQFRFRTIRPVPYPGRTPHIHVKLRHASFGEVTSQLFVAGDPGNARDFLWRGLSADDRPALEMRLQPAPGDSGLRWLVRHELVLPA
jgi:protocatechuate 3,4-dioxygenase beta subunit